LKFGVELGMQSRHVLAVVPDPILNGLIFDRQIIEGLGIRITMVAIMPRHDASAMAGIASSAILIEARFYWVT
jgi:hypothetical protein